ncbi:hypothetical protein GCM10023185_15820 [Hymenobacter saemangeumensis]|uniref:DUF4288 domain-containing protein n=1 Tax=Hymenobacter saemangeumensis TaxID=1084522 RepID=A0ABP8I9Y5_9BACT
MIYVVLQTFLEVEVACQLGKELLLNKVKAHVKDERSYWREEGNVYEIQILYHQNLVIIWDTIIQYEPQYEDQEPFISNLNDFVKALEEYTPLK